MSEVKKRWLVSTLIQITLIALSTWVFFSAFDHSAALTLLGGMGIALAGAFLWSRFSINAPSTNGAYALLSAIGIGLLWALVAGSTLLVENPGSAAIAIIVPLLCGAQFVFGLSFSLSLWLFRRLL